MIPSTNCPLFKSSVYKIVQSSEIAAAIMSESQKENCVFILISTA